MSAKPLRRVVVTLGGVLLALVCAEAALRGAGRLYSRWRLPNDALDEDAVRVLCVGDSFTFGVGAGKGQSYPEQLQKLLDAKDGKGMFQVVNGGVPASNSSQLVAGLPDLLDEWRPNVLVVMTGWNDTNVAGSNYWRVLSWSQMPPWTKAGFYWRDFLNNCRLYKLASAALARRPAAGARSQWEVVGGMPPDQIPGEISALEAQVKKDPAGFKDWLKLGILYHKSKRFPEALEAYKRAVQQEPGNAEAHYQLAWMDHLLRDFVSAKAEVQKSLDIDPTNPSAQTLMGNYVGQGANPLPPDTWIKPLLRYDLERVLELAQQRGARVILETYPNPNAINDKLGDAYERLARRHRVTIVDQGGRFRALPQIRSYFSGDEPELFASHLNAKGYAVMAQDLVSAVEAFAPAPPAR